MTTISDLTALLVEHGWPRVEPPDDSDTNPTVPSGPWWCLDPEEQLITLHPQPTLGITVEYDDTTGQLLDTTAWSEAFHDIRNDDPDHPAELLAVAVWPPGPPRQTLDWLLQTAEQQLQAITNLTANQ